MVVVYAGQSERPPLSFEGEDEAALDRAFGPQTPPAPAPFLLKRDLASPALPTFEGFEGEATTRPRLATLADFSEPNSASELEPPQSLAPTRTADDAPAVAVSAQAIPRDSIPPVPDPQPRTSRPPVARKRAARWPYVMLASLAVGGLVSIGVHRQRRLAESASVAAVEKPPVKVVAASVAEPVRPAAPQLTIPVPNDSPTTNEPAAVQARPTSTLVVLDVTPWDAKVAVKGVQQSGPPFVFDIPPGKRIVTEVARRGFVPRRVVIDGSTPRVTIGLLSTKVAHWRDNLKASVPGAKANPDAVKEPEAPVQSGL
jgi:hypothetical protein